MKKNPTPAMPYINRELSWLDFNARVLEEAYEKENPVLERCKFLGITASNLDEFFMVRVAGVKEQVRSGYKEPDAAGLTPEKQLSLLSEKIHAFAEKQATCFSPFPPASPAAEGDRPPAGRGDGRGSEGICRRVL